MLTLKYAATCRLCGVPMAVGTAGQYDRDIPDVQKRWRCPPCFGQGPGEPVAVAVQSPAPSPVARAAADSTARAMSTAARVFGSPTLASRAMCPHCGCGIAVVVVADGVSGEQWAEAVAAEQRGAAEAAEAAEASATAAVAAGRLAETAAEQARTATGFAGGVLTTTAQTVKRIEVQHAAAVELVAAAEAAATAAAASADRAALLTRPAPEPAALVDAPAGVGRRRGKARS